LCDFVRRLYVFLMVSQLPPGGGVIERIVEVLEPEQLWLSEAVRARRTDQIATGT